MVLDEPSGRITLAPDTSRLIPHGDPSKWNVITEMVVFQNRLLAFACLDFETPGTFQPFAYSNGAQTLEFLPERNEWTILRDEEASMIFNARVVGDRLMIPEFFPLQERSRLVHTFDGKTWGMLGLLPIQNWHVMDVLRWKEKLYVSGSWRDAGEEAPKDDPHWWPGYGRVFESEDDGKTWKEIRRTKENGRVIDMVEYHGRLYANERGEHLIAWDGTRWEEIAVSLDTKEKIEPKLGNAQLFVFADRIVAINDPLYYLYDGKTWSSHVPGFIDAWVKGGTLYGLRSDGSVHSSPDAKKWTPITKEGVPQKEFDRVTGQGKRPLHRGSLAVFQGRLFVGTGNEGTIYASAFEKKGRLVSKPVEWTEKSPPSLEWAATSPAGTSVALSFRSSDRADRLSKAAWREVRDPSPAKLPLPSGHRWVQYRIDMEGDGCRSPILQSCRVSVFP